MVTFDGNRNSEAALYSAVLFVQQRYHKLHLVGGNLSAKDPGELLSC